MVGTNNYIVPTCFYARQKILSTKLRLALSLRPKTGFLAKILIPGLPGNLGDLSDLDVRSPQSGAA